MRTCEICGALVTNINPKVTTCGPICTRAKHAGRTLKHQMRREAERVSDYKPTVNEEAYGYGLASKPHKLED